MHRREIAHNSYSLYYEGFIAIWLTELPKLNQCFACAVVIHGAYSGRRLSRWSPDICIKKRHRFSC